MHRTVNNQQGELFFPKCQAYNLKKMKEFTKKNERRTKDGNKNTIKRKDVENMNNNAE